MSSYNAAAADLVKTTLTTGVGASAFGAGMTFTPRRVYVPLFPPTDLDDLQVYISPREASTRSRLDRAGTQQKTITVDVAVAQKLPEGIKPYEEAGNAWLDARLEIAEKIADYFTRASTAGKWISTEHNLFNREMFETNSVFFSLITLTLDP